MSELLKNVGHVCSVCGSRDVRRNADCSWDEVEQKWVVEVVFDAASCENCGGETSLDTVRARTLAGLEGAYAGYADARRHDVDVHNFERTENPHSIETEAWAYEAWEKEYEDAFEGNITKPCQNE